MNNFFKNKHIVSLDGIRGFAVLFVAIHHMIFGISRGYFEIPESIRFFAVSGVDLFFVLSGFLIGGIIIDEYKDKFFWKKFMLRRIGRIFPVYFLLVGSFSIAILFFHHKWFFDDFLLCEPLPIWPYFIFMQSYFQGMENLVGPRWVGITWSLSVEEQFYIFLPIIAIIFARKGIFLAIFVAILIAPFVRAWAISNYGFYGGYMLFPARMDSIAMGVAVAIIVRNYKIYYFLSKSKLIYLLPFIIYFAAQTRVIPIIDSFTFKAMFYASVITILAIKRNYIISLLFENKVITFFGSISFGLYMYHQLISGLTHGVVYWRAPKIDSIDSFSVSIFALLIAIAVSTVSLKYFEKPIRTYFKNKSNQLYDKA